MTRHPVRQDARPVVHYYPVPDPTALDLAQLADPANVAVYRQHVAEVAARRKRDQVLIARWKQRREQIAARDRRNRRVLLLIAVPAAVAALSALGTAGWLLYHALSGINVVIVLLLAAFGLATAGGVGHRCITVVQHWHE